MKLWKDIDPTEVLVSNGVVTLKKGEGRLLKSGGAWVFDNEVASIYNEFLDIGGRNYRSEYIWACPLASIKSGITLEFVDN